MKKAIRVLFRGKKALLSAHSAQNGMTTVQGYQRWVMVGRPDVLPDDFFTVRLRHLEDLAKGGYSLDGKPVKRDVIAKALGVHIRAVLKLANAQGGKAFFTVRPTKKAPTRKTVSAPDDRSPGWWERKHLASAGSNGFCKCEIHNSLSLGQLGYSMPISEARP